MSFSFTNLPPPLSSSSPKSFWKAIMGLVSKAPLSEGRGVKGNSFFIAEKLKALETRPNNVTVVTRDDAQFKIGGTSKFSAAFWYPEDGKPWHGSGHYTVSCDWLPLNFASGGSTLSAAKNAPSSSWDAAAGFSLLLSVVAFCVSILVVYRVSMQKGVAFTPMSSL